MTTIRMRLGEQGERMASNHLLNQGYTILEKNYRCRHGEVDIVAQQGAEVVFTEVRTRRSVQFGTPQESITKTKAKHLIATSQHYLERHSLTDIDWRIDLVSINWPQGSAEPGIEHLEYAVGDGWA